MPLLFLSTSAKYIGTKDGLGVIKIGYKKRHRLWKILGKNHKKEPGTIGN